MPIRIDISEQHHPGDAFLVASESTDRSAVAVFFEDDGETGYFYACGAVNGPILDALQIYVAATVADGTRESRFEIGWSSLGRQAVLLINEHPHAVFDFDRERGWCRNGFPPANSGAAWSRDGHAWDESCLDSFA